MKYLIVTTLWLFCGCDAGPQKEPASEPVYVKPSVDSRGRYRKGHIRKPVSTSKNAVKNRNRSRYHYHSRGKYRRKLKKKE